MDQKHLNLTLLCEGLAQAVAVDEQPEMGGFDLSAGMFGERVSAWLRDVADAVAYYQTQEELLSKVQDEVQRLRDELVPYEPTASDLERLWSEADGADEPRWERFGRIVAEEAHAHYVQFSGDVQRAEQQPKLDWDGERP